MPNRWAPLGISQYITETGFKIILHTFQPCHLWMRWTIVLPQEHTIPRIVRGVPFVADKSFCFVAFHDNEQEEDGDTFDHTFIKEPWPVCETRYFYFHGQIAGNPSPSTSAIFSKHRLGGFIWREEYTIAEWIPTYLFRDEYSVPLDENKMAHIFTEKYWTL